MDVMEFTLDEAFEILTKADPQLSYMLSSSPGLGKSSLVQQIADHLNAGVVKVELSLRDITDLIGIPWADGEVTRYKPFEWAYHLTQPDGPPMILFLDDFGLAMQQVQNAGLSIFLDRIIGQGRMLRNNVRVIGATNRPKDRTGVEELPPTVKNRFIHIPVKEDLNSWTNWAIENSIDPTIIAFHRKTRTNLNTFDPNCSEDAQATPRSWSFASRIYQSMVAAQCSDMLVLKALGGTIGTGMASTFFSFAKIKDQMLAPEDIIADPKGVTPPKDDEPDIHMVTMSALESYMVQNHDKWREAVTYALRIPAEMGVLFLGRLIRVLKNKLEPDEFAEFVTGKLMQEADAKWSHLITD